MLEADSVERMTHYPTWHGPEWPKHPQQKSDDGHMSQTGERKLEENASGDARCKPCTRRPSLVPCKSFSARRRVHWCWRMARLRLTWRSRNTPFLVSTTGACFISGRRNETPSGECWRRRSRMERCVLPYSGWDRHVHSDWKFAVSAIAALPQRAELPAPRMNRSCVELWIATFQTSRLQS